LSESLVYWAYGMAAMGALAIFVGLPKGGRPARRGLLSLLMVLTGGALLMLLDRVLGGAAEQVSFCVLASLGIGAAVRVVTHPKPVYSALYFVFVVLSTAALIIHVGAEFLGAALVIIYAGAILVTYVFVIMLAQPSSAAPTGRWAAALDYDRSAREPFWAVVAGFALLATLSQMIVSRQWPPLDESGVAAMMDRNTLELGKVLMTEFAISVELAAVLLMVAMIGAIAIARKRIPRADEGVETPPPGAIGKAVEPF